MVPHSVIPAAFGRRAVCGEPALQHGPERPEGVLNIDPGKDGGVEMLLGQTLLAVIRPNSTQSHRLAYLGV